MSNLGWYERHGGLCLFFRSHLLPIFTVVSVIVGIGTGFGLRTRAEPWTDREIMYISFPGYLYIRILYCLILPLITSSLISSLGCLDPLLSGRIAMRAVVYYLITLPCAVGLGVLLVTTIRPGKGTEPQRVRPNVKLQGGEVPGTPVDTIMDLMRNLFTDNLVTSCFEQYKTVLVPRGSESSDDDNNSDEGGTFSSGTSNATDNRTTSIYNYKISSTYESGNNNIVGLVFMCVILGVSIRRLKRKGRPFLKFVISLYEIVMEISNFVIWLSPICIMFLICGQVLEIRDFCETLEQICVYVGTVLLGLMIHGFLVIPLIYFVVTRSNPYRFLWNQVEALTTAFATNSSTITMPVAIRCLEDHNAIHPKVARFVIPIGIVNTEGCALYEAVSVIFIAQLNGMEMTTSEIFVLSLTSVAASMGAAGFPEAGLAVIVLILNSVGLPPESISLIAAVDFMLNRLRVMVNVLSDCSGAGIVNYLSKLDLKSYDSVCSVDNVCYGQKSSSLNGKTCSAQKEKRVSFDSGVDIV